MIGCLNNVQINAEFSVSIVESDFLLREALKKMKVMNFAENNSKKDLLVL